MHLTKKKIENKTKKKIENKTKKKIENKTNIRRLSSKTRKDIRILLKQTSRKKRPTLRHLTFIGEGATTDVFRKEDIVYKYNIRGTQHTRFATSPEVITEMVKRGFVLSETHIEGGIYSSEYCTPLWKEDLTIQDIIKCSVICIHFADALATYDIYGQDFHFGNIGKRENGQYILIDNEGFFKAITSKKKKKVIFKSIVSVIINGHSLPHSTDGTWLEPFDPVNGWFAEDEHSIWTTQMLQYIKYMKKIKTISDIRLRNFISQYFFIGQHMVYGLKLLHITKVYAKATLTTKRGS